MFLKLQNERFWKLPVRWSRDLMQHVSAREDWDRGQ